MYYVGGVLPSLGRENLQDSEGAGREAAEASRRAAGARAPDRPRRPRRPPCCHHRSGSKLSCSFTEWVHLYSAARFVWSDSKWPQTWWGKSMVPKADLCVLFCSFLTQPPERTRNMRNLRGRKENAIPNLLHGNANTDLSFFVTKMNLGGKLQFASCQKKKKKKY